MSNSKRGDAAQASQSNRHPLNVYIGLRIGIAIVRFFSLAETFVAIEQRRAVPKDVKVTRTRVPSREKGRTIKVVVYEPPLSAPATSHDGGAGGRRAVNFNMHGSGFTIPALDCDAEFCGRLASTLGTIVFDCEYRKAPEHPFPCALEDLEDIVAYVQSQPERYDVDHLTASGFSAGGNLALSLATSTPSRFSAVCGFYASVKLDSQHEAPEKEHDSGVVIPPFVRRFFYRCLVVDHPKGLSSPRISVSYQPTSSFPPHVSLACGRADALYSPAEELVARLKREGHPDAAFLSLEREAHAFDKQAKSGTKSGERKERMYEAAFETIKRSYAYDRQADVEKKSPSSSVDGVAKGVLPGASPSPATLPPSGS